MTSEQSLGAAADATKWARGNRDLCSLEAGLGAQNRPEMSKAA